MLVILISLVARFQNKSMFTEMIDSIRRSVNSEVVKNQRVTTIVSYLSCFSAFLKLHNNMCTPQCNACIALQILQYYRLTHAIFLHCSVPWLWVALELLRKLVLEMPLNKLLRL